MRKAPFRADNEISQSFSSGVCTVYRQEDAAKPGRMKKPKLSQKAKLRYEEQRLGLNRYYAARQVDIEVERVIRGPQPPAPQIPTPRDVVKTENGRVYRVDFVQTVPGVFPKCLDLTLVRLEREAVVS